MAERQVDLVEHGDENTTHLDGGLDAQGSTISLAAVTNGVLPSGEIVEVVDSAQPGVNDQRFPFRISTEQGLDVELFELTDIDEVELSRSEGGVVKFSRPNTTVEDVPIIENEAGI